MQHGDSGRGYESGLHSPVTHLPRQSRDSFILPPIPFTPKYGLCVCAQLSGIDNFNVRSYVITLTGFQASYCVGVCKPSSAWNFITASSQMVQTLGFHDRFSFPDDDAETKTCKIQLFWSIYVVEKGLSLQLGRSSTIRDIDVTVLLPVQYPKLDFIFGSTSFRPIELSRLQGMVYDNIYSPAALMQPDIVRISRVKALVKELESLANLRVSTYLHHSCLPYIPPSFNPYTKHISILSFIPLQSRCPDTDHQIFTNVDLARKPRRRNKRGEFWGFLPGDPQSGSQNLPTILTIASLPRHAYQRGFGHSLLPRMHCKRS